MAGGLAIVLSGGGAKGAFQVGVVHELVVNRGVCLDIVAGVSTGAIQALAVAQDDVPELLDTWLAIRGNSSIYKERPLGVIGGLLGEDALYDTAPLKRLLKGFA
ncbi:MAG: patatin-like phospholipase family protein, partial [Sphingopyxis sp.]